MRQSDKIEQICNEIFSQARASIVLKMRYMDLAIFKLKPIPGNVQLATDGQYLFYESKWILQRYQKEQNSITRDYVHVLLHCIFRHPFVGSSIDSALWDLASDIAAEAIINDLNHDFLEVEKQTRQKEIISRLQTVSKLPLLSAEKLYHFFSNNPPDKEWFALFCSDDHSSWYNNKLRNSLRNSALSVPGDSKDEDNGGNNANDENEGVKEKKEYISNLNSHESSSNDNEHSKSLSKELSDKANTQTSSEQGNNEEGDLNNSQDSEATESQSARNQQLNESSPKAETQDSALNESQNIKEERQNRQNSNKEEKHSQSDSSLKEEEQEMGASSSKNPFTGKGVHDQSLLESQENIDSSIELSWKDISTHIQVNLETFFKTQGNIAGNFQQMLFAANREKYNYKSFLRKFASIGEVMRINDDEFDYIFYTYGLQLYEKMPLIEPLEYKEVKRIREFVIAIDTSGSTSGELVNAFLNETFKILQSSESFFDKVNIYIIQCDAEIQEVKRIETKKALEEYIKSITIKGLGGTDFRPVFNYVDGLIRRRDLKNLKGLIYFTDGEGVFPKHKPEYDVAFVFIKKVFEDVIIPPWAMKIVLEEGEILMQ